MLVVVVLGVTVFSPPRGKVPNGRDEQRAEAPARHEEVPDAPEAPLTKPAAEQTVDAGERLESPVKAGDTEQPPPGAVAAFEPGVPIAPGAPFGPGAAGPAPTRGGAGNMVCTSPFAGNAAQGRNCPWMCLGILDCDG